MVHVLKFSGMPHNRFLQFPSVLYMHELQARRVVSEC